MKQKGFSINRILPLLILVSTAFLQSVKAQDTSARQTNDTVMQARKDHSEQVTSNTLAEDHKPVYKVNYWFSGIFSIVATAANLYAIPTFIHGKKDLTDAELAGIKKKEDFSGIERWALDQDPSQREKYYNISDIFLPSMVAVSGLSLLLDPKIRKDWRPVFMMYYEMHAATFTLYNYSPLGPTFTNKYRPIVYYTYFSPAERKAGNQKNSQYSGHVASTIASTYFAVKVYSDYHPELGAKKYLLYTLATIPPVVEGMFRVKALAHFPSDVAIGLGVGALTGILVPQLHKIKYDRNTSVGLNFSHAGNPEFAFRWNMSRSRKVLNTFHEEKVASR